MSSTAGEGGGGVKPKKFAPSQYVIDKNDGNSKWRIAVACAVLNSNNELLVGERINIKNAWQAPQGGVDDAWEENNFAAESVADAACRELYEEMGLIHNQHVVLLTNENINNNDDEAIVKPIRYETKGTKSWLTINGFSGQELHWCVFRCIDGKGNNDPNDMCDLSGKNGESTEFSAVQWKSMDWVVTNMWPAKRGPYEALQQSLFTNFKSSSSSSGNVIKQWNEKCMDLDFGGTWSRDASLNDDVESGLIQRGIPTEKAIAEATRPYVQKWSRREQRSLSFTTWNVKTYNNDDAKTIRRELNYSMGSWVESFEGNALIFGVTDGKGGTLERTTSFVYEPDADNRVAHVTITKCPRTSVTNSNNDGDVDTAPMEESRRYLKNDSMILRRTYWPGKKEEAGVVSKEFFIRTPDY